MASFDYDVVIIGSGFGGSVAALRAAEKGYRVGVMESGRRWKDEDIPKTPVASAATSCGSPRRSSTGSSGSSTSTTCSSSRGAGVGGGSHVYANTLYVPPKQFFDAPEWASITDWADELAPHLDQATRMLGVVRYPYMPTDVDRVMQQVATEMGRGETFNKAPVGVYFGSPGVEADDPYFGGVGPRRTGCISCGNCNIGCGHNAKNKLTTNYLYLAEKLGAEVHELHEVYDLVPLDGGGFEVHARHPGWAQRAAHLHHHTYTAEQVIVAAHAYGSAKLLHAHAAQGPPDRPLERARATRADELRAAARDHADARRVEARSGEDPHHAGVGLDHLRRLAGSGDEHRARLLGRRKRPVRVPRHLPPARRAEAPDRGLAQGADRAPDRGAQLRRPAPLGRADRRSCSARRRPTPRSSCTGTTACCAAGTPARLPSVHIPIVEEFVDRMAAKMDGREGALPFEVINRTASAHFTGGIPIGDSSETGAVDPYQRVFGQPGLHVMDGSVMPANTGREPVAHDHRPGRARDVAVAEQGRRGHQAAAGLRLRARRPGHAAPSGRARRRSGRAATRREEGRRHPRLPLLNRLDERRRR